MDVLEAMARRSSTRAYTDQPLTEAELDTLLTAGLQAPTATNRQEIHFTVVNGDNPILAEIEAHKNAMFGQNPPVNFYYGAPTVMILSGETAFSWTPVDAGIAVQNIALAAEGLGLGSVIIGCIKGPLTSNKAPYYAEKLGFPEGYGYQIAIAVGHKAAAKEPHALDRSKVNCI